MNKNILCLIVCPILFSSCFGLIDNGCDTVADDYEICWIDLHKNRSLTKGEELVPAYIFAAGHDKNFIYVKQHPLSTKPGEIIDTTVTNYYLITRTKNAFQDKPKYGPLTKHDFIKLCRKQRISKVTFDLEYPVNLY